MLSCVRRCVVLCSVLCVVLSSVLCCVLLGVVLGGQFDHLGSHFGHLGGHFGHLGRHFGHLEGHFWRLGSLLGPPESPWVVEDQKRASKDRWGSSLGAPKGGQDEAKMGPKRHQNRCQKRRRKKKLLKIVLEPSWVDLGSSWVPSWGHFRALPRAGARF